MGKIKCICCGKDIEKCKTKIPSSCIPWGIFAPITDMPLERYVPQKVTRCREDADLIGQKGSLVYTTERKYKHALPTGGVVTGSLARMSWGGHSPRSSGYVKKKAHVDVTSGVGPIGIRHRLMETILAKSQGSGSKKAPTKKR